MISFSDCLFACAENKDFVNEFNRLSGFNLCRNRSPLEIAIDSACGYEPDKEAIQSFIKFVYDFVWQPIKTIE